MTSGRRSPIILVANNPFGHHLLTSQLLDIYRSLALDTEILLFCNGTMSNAGIDPAQPIKVVSFATKTGGASSFVNLVFKLVRARWAYPDAVYHLRGFVSGALFFLSRLGNLRRARYIYDPRGAFFAEWREAGRSGKIGRLFFWLESRLIRDSLATVVTSERFAKLYRRIFGHQGRYLTIYNSTSFAFNGREPLVSADEKLRVVYLGTFNHWHDMGEVVRVMSSIAQQFGPNRVDLFIYTLPRFHEAVRERLRDVDCAAFTVEYVNYERIPGALLDKHVGVSVVRPSLSSRIASPIKVSDYVALGLVPLINRGIGDFDAHFEAEDSAILYDFGEVVDMSAFERVRTAPNRRIYDLVSQARACSQLAPVVERLRHG